MYVWLCVLTAAPHIHTHTRRYTSSGAESALQRCVERLGELQRQSGERGQERKELEERTKALQKQLANAKVSRWCLISFVT